MITRVSGLDKKSFSQVAVQQKASDLGRMGDVKDRMYVICGVLGLVPRKF